MIIQEDELLHYGTPRHSGRYPWGSGGDADARSRDFLGMLDDLEKKGLSQTEIAKAMGFATLNPDGSLKMKSDGVTPFSNGTTQLRNRRTVALNAREASLIAQAERLAATGMSKRAIADEMGLPNESSVRALLAPGRKDKNLILNQTVAKIREAVDKKKYVDVGAYVEHQMNISRSKFDAAVSMLQEEGFVKHYVKLPQLGTKWETTYKILTKSGVPYNEVKKNFDKIQQITDFSTDGGRSYEGKLHFPVSIDSKRVAVKWAEDGGAEQDGMLYLRPGVSDTSLGSSHYAQVRVAVDGTHYLKGMAMYKDDLPKGVDIEFHTNKSRADTGGDKFKAFKEFEKNPNDPINPFNSAIKRQQGVLNILNEEGKWDEWSHTFSSQFLSKQPHKFAEKQLGVLYENKKSEHDEIMSLTNPVVRKKLLQEFADSADHSATNLEAAGLPKTATHVILPFSSIKQNEIYAPNYANGTRVALVRHPHGGQFEIPDLVVNNNNSKAKKLFGNIQDAVAIHHTVAEKLSGADFDGDTVLVIPNNRGEVKHSPMLEGLKNFDHRHMYPQYEGMHVMTPHETQVEMGKISNLITDMSVKGAPSDEIARAVRHSMVVIDAEKHKLNYKQSEIENNIKQLKKKWQTPPYYGASTLISRAGSRKDVPERKQLIKIDPKTGEQIYTPTGKQWVDKTGKIVTPKTRSTKLAETTDAHTLSSGTVIEKVYADHSNRLKAMANQARKEAYFIKGHTHSPSASKAYATEVASLKAALVKAQLNAPLERQAQIVGNALVRQLRDANPEMTLDNVKKIKNSSLKEARARTGAGKTRIKITDKQWEAIQAGAITTNMLNNILDNADMDIVKKLATPKQHTLMTDSKHSRAVAMLKNGHTQAEVALALGVSLSTLKRSIGEQ